MKVGFTHITEKIIKIIPESNRFERIWKLAQIDFKKRYYNDKLGLFWALINPSIKVAIYYVVFKKIMNNANNGIENYALFLFSGIIVWMAFSETIKRGLRIFMSKRYLIENINLNKEDLFLSNSLSVQFGFLFNFTAVLIISFFTNVPITTNLLWLPIIILNIYLISTGLSVILAIIYIYIRDVMHIIDIFLLLGFWTSGIFFSSESIYNFSKIYYYTNPFVGILENIRVVILNEGHLNIGIMSLNITAGIIIFTFSKLILSIYSDKILENI